jgi:Rieske Fe-S protein
MGLVDNAVKKLAETQMDRGRRGSPAGEASRRNFLNWLWAGLGGVVLLELGWIAAAYLRPLMRPAAGGEARLWFEAGPVGAFAAGTVSAFPRGRFYLARLADGGFLALSRRCTHLGCTVPWNAETGRFECPCHASVFDIRGAVLRAPAQRALGMHPLVIENNTIRVDTGRLVGRSGFRPEQVVYPK